MGDTAHTDLDLGRTAAQQRTWRVVAALEVVLAAVAVVADRVVPTFVILVLAGLSLAARRRSPATLGFHRHRGPPAWSRRSSAGRSCGPSCCWPW